MLLLSFVVVFSVGIITTGEAYQSCTWKLFPFQQIVGGDFAAAETLEECQTACEEKPECQGVDFDERDENCYLLKTQEPKTSDQNVQHYDRNCVDINPCATNPCQNDGQCTASGESYTCSCQPGYSGNNCETLFNPCASNPCQNGGTCTQSGSGYVCSCLYGYVGANCESRDSCIPNPCQNGGSCGRSGSGYACTCASGYTGTNCEARAIRDLVSSVGDARCFKTNYQGPMVSDLWTAPNGVTWNFQVANFGFDWPQTGILFIPFGSFLYIDQITFVGSDNLNSFRVAFTSNFGKVITTNDIGPNDKTTVLSGVKDVKRVDFYLIPSDFSRNVSLYDVSFKCCIKDPFWGLIGTCVLFDLVKGVIQIASLGIVRPGGTSGTFSMSISAPNPYVELDLQCSGAGTVNFAGVSFGQTSNFYRVSIAVWNGYMSIPVYDQNGVATTIFNNPSGIAFGSNVRGDRIRVTIFPSSAQGQSGTIWFSKFSVTGA